MIRKFVKKPVVVEGIQVTLAGLDNAFEFCPSLKVKNRKEIEIKTLEGVARGVIGDYILKGVVGEYWIVREDIFEQTYELV